MTTTKRMSMNTNECQIDIQTPANPEAKGVSECEAGNNGCDSSSFPLRKEGFAGQRSDNASVILTPPPANSGPALSSSKADTEICTGCGDQNCKEESCATCYPQLHSKCKPANLSKVSNCPSEVASTNPTEISNKPATDEERLIIGRITGAYESEDEDGAIRVLRDCIRKEAAPYKKRLEEQSKNYHEMFEGQESKAIEIAARYIKQNVVPDILGKAIMDCLCAPGPNTMHICAENSGWIRRDDAKEQKQQAVEKALSEDKIKKALEVDCADGHFYRGEACRYRVLAAKKILLGVKHE